MISVPAGVRVLVATKPVDFRRGADSLAALAKEELQRDPFSGTIFVFRSKRADRLKILAWDGSGLILYWKRLEEGAFRWPPISDGVMRLSAPQLAALVDDLTGRANTRGTRRLRRRRHRDCAVRPDLSPQAQANLIPFRAVSADAKQPPPARYALEARLAAALAERDAAIAERDAALTQDNLPMHLLRQLQRMQFGRKSEKLDPVQFALALEEIERAEGASEATDDKRNKAAAAARAEKRRAPRGALPVHLPRVHVTIEPEDRNCPCCRSPMHAIGADISERLDVIPAQFRVLVTRRPKYECRACEQAVVQAPAPERLIKGGLPTEAIVASVLVSKYAWHLPLHRQAQMLAAQGLDIKRSMLAFWVGYAAAELRPVYERLRELTLTSNKIAVDATKAPVLDPGRGRVKEGSVRHRVPRPYGGASRSQKRSRSGFDHKAFRWSTAGTRYAFARHNRCGVLFS